MKSRSFAEGWAFKLPNGEGQETREPGFETGRALIEPREPVQLWKIHVVVMERRGWRRQAPGLCSVAVRASRHRRWRAQLEVSWTAVGRANPLAGICARSINLNTLPVAIRKSGKWDGTARHRYRLASSRALALVLSTGALSFSPDPPHSHSDSFIYSRPRKS